MLYSRNLITQSDSVSGYNNAVRQVNKTNEGNIKYLKEQYEKRQNSYQDLQAAKESLDSAVDTLKRYIACLNELVGAL